DFPIFGYIFFIFISSSPKPVTCNGGMVMPSWFDIYSLSPSGRDDKQGVESSSDYLISLVKKEENTIPANRIMLGGFSQGGAVSIYTCFKKARNIPFAGLIALSCWVPCNQDFKQKVEKSTIPTLMCFGDCDILLPLSYGKMSNDLIKTFNPTIEFKSYVMGHESCPEVILKFILIKKSLGNVRPSFVDIDKRYSKSRSDLDILSTVFQPMTSSMNANFKPEENPNRAPYNPSYQNDARFATRENYMVNRMPHNPEYPYNSNVHFPQTKSPVVSSLYDENKNSQNSIHKNNYEYYNNHMPHRPREYPYFQAEYKNSRIDPGLQSPNSQMSFQYSVDPNTDRKMFPDPKMHTHMQNPGAKIPAMMANSAMNESHSYQYNPNFMYQQKMEHINTPQNRHTYYEQSKPPYDPHMYSSMPHYNPRNSVYSPVNHTQYSYKYPSNGYEPLDNHRFPRHPQKYMGIPDPNQNYAMSNVDSKNYQNMQYMRNQNSLLEKALSPNISPNHQNSKKSLQSMDILKKQLEMGIEPERSEFLHKLFSFMDQIGSPINEYPVISKYMIDLFKLFTTIQGYGGVYNVTKNKKWREICTILGMSSSGSGGFSLKKRYVSYLLYYECYFCNNQENPTLLIQKLDSIKIRRDTRKKPIAYDSRSPKTTNDSQMDNSEDSRDTTDITISNQNGPNSDEKSVNNEPLSKNDLPNAYSRNDYYSANRQMKGPYKVSHPPYNRSVYFPTVNQVVDMNENNYHVSMRKNLVPDAYNRPREPRPSLVMQSKQSPFQNRYYFNESLNSTPKMLKQGVYRPHQSNSVSEQSGMHEMYSKYKYMTDQGNNSDVNMLDVKDDRQAQGYTNIVDSIKRKYGFHPIYKKGVTFPENCTENTALQDKKQEILKSNKLSETLVNIFNFTLVDIDPWKIVMSLKCGLITDLTWALDVLSVLICDDEIVYYFDLKRLSGLLAVLVSLYCDYVSSVFPVFREFYFKDQTEDFQYRVYDMYEPPSKSGQAESLSISDNKIDDTPVGIFSMCKEQTLDRLTRLCAISTILRNLSFVPGNDENMGTNFEFISLLSKLIDYDVENVKQVSTHLDDVIESEFNKCMRKDEHFKFYLTIIRENNLVILGNVAGILKLDLWNDKIVCRLVGSVIYWITCKSTIAESPFAITQNSSLSPERICIEILCKLIVINLNFDYILVSNFDNIIGFINIIDQKHLINSEQMMREFSIVVLCRFAESDKKLLFEIASRKRILQRLIEFVEVAESQSYEVVSIQGPMALKKNPELMGTTKDILLRCCRIFYAIAVYQNTVGFLNPFKTRLMYCSMTKLFDEKIIFILTSIVFFIDNGCNLDEDVKMKTSNPQQ
ncbi:hypothetical protein A3Q56_02049, partial [Intoshia linei]